MATDLVVGVQIRDEARAYPVGALNKREMVLDLIEAEPILVTWCPRCATAMVYRRVVDGREIVLGNQGALCNEAMTWWDHDTGSVWSQPTGEAIAGPRRGKSLELVPSTLTTWRSWRERHPQTIALKQRARPGHYRLGELMIGVTVLGDTAGYSVERIRDAGTVNDEVGGTPIAVTIDPADPDTWTVVSRLLGDRVVSLVRRDDAIADADTGEVWSHGPDGALHTERGESRLGPLPAFTVHPKDFHGIWPAGRIWG